MPRKALARCQRLTSAWKLLLELQSLGSDYFGREEESCLWSVYPLPGQAGEWLGRAVWSRIPLENAASDCWMPWCEAGPRRRWGYWCISSCSSPAPALSHCCAVDTNIWSAERVLRGCICSVQISFWRWITDSRKSSNCLDSPHVPGTVSRILAACVLPTLRLGAVELEAQGAKSERVFLLL